MHAAGGQTLPLRDLRGLAMHGAGGQTLPLRDLRLREYWRRTTL